MILDLEGRGLLDETLVLVISEHGRTPLLDRKAPGGGRDHWSRAYSQVYAGGGMGRGRVVGATDRLGGDVVETPVSPKDILATAFHLTNHVAWLDKLFAKHQKAGRKYKVVYPEAGKDSVFVDLGDKFTG